MRWPRTYKISSNIANESFGEGVFLEERQSEKKNGPLEFELQANANLEVVFDMIALEGAMRGSMRKRKAREGYER